jgi:hypothetical protein
MPEILDEWPPEAMGHSKYPWDEWFDGKVRLLVHGKDFKVTPDSFRATCYWAGRRKGFHIRAAVVGIKKNKVALQQIGERDE